MLILTTSSMSIPCSRRTLAWPSHVNVLEHSSPIVSSMRRFHLLTPRAWIDPLIEAWQLIPTSARRLSPRSSASIAASGVAA